MWNINQKKALMIEAASVVKFSASSRSLAYEMVNDHSVIDHPLLVLSACNITAPAVVTVLLCNMSVMEVYEDWLTED
jgi:hypothetical protein